MTAKGFERKEKIKSFKKGIIFLIGDMGNYGVSENEMNIREVILEKEGYCVFNPVRIIPYNSSEMLRNRILIAKLMECKKVFVMLKYEKSSINHILVDLAAKLDYEIIYEKGEST